jgi:hypothetical protein
MQGFLIRALLWVAALCLLVALVSQSAAQDGDSQGTQPCTTVTAQRGTTEALLPETEQWKGTAIGDAYAGGTELRTGKRSYVEVCLDKDNSFRIKSDTQVAVEKILEAAEEEAGTVVRLVELQVIDGEVSARLKKLPEGVRVKIASPTAVAGAMGTGFTVGFTKATGVSSFKVIQNAVVVEALDKADKQVTVNALEQVVVIPWRGGKITAEGRGVLSEKLLGKDFLKRFRQKPGQIMVTTTCTAPAPDDATDKQERRAESQAAALDAARAGLSALVLSLAVDESSMVSDLLAKDAALAGRVYALIAVAPAIETTFTDEDACTVTVQADVGAIGRALGRNLPATIASVREIAEADYLGTFGEQAALTTKQAAEADAKRRLAEKITGCVIGKGRTLGDEARRNALVRTIIEGVVGGAVLERTWYFSDGSVTVLMSCSGDRMAQDLGDLVGDTYLSSPEPVVVNDFADYRELSFRVGAIETAAKGKGGKPTQGETAKTLARMLGLEGEIEGDGSVLDYINFWRGHGVNPLGGWDPNAEMTDEVLAELLVQVLGLLGEVEDPSNPHDYVDVLDRLGIALSNARDVLGDLGVSVQIVYTSPLAGLYQENLSSVRGY